jgi:short-subunit dehydrogenase
MPFALITGASAGIGREFAQLYAAEGYDLVLVARDRDRLDTLASEIRAKHQRTVYVVAKDLSEREAVVEIFREISNAAIDVDALVNNAGFGLLGYFWEADAAATMRMVYVNIAALTELTHLFLPAMIKRRRGHVLNIASTAAFQPGPLMAVYFASKAYVVSFSQALYNEARNFGVTVTALCPGATRTEFAERAGMTGTRLFKSAPGMSAAEVARIGYHAVRAGKPLVVAGLLNRLMAFSTRLIPAQLAGSIARKLQEL